nr:hypothetical protein [Tanacetum cinerariifolium]
MTPFPSYVFTLLGIRVLHELSNLRIRGVNGSSSSHIHGLVKSSSSVDLCLFDLEFRYLSSLESLFNTLDSGDSLSLLFFIWRERFPSQYEWEKESSYDYPMLRKRSLSFRQSFEVSNLWGRLLSRGWSLESVLQGLNLVCLATNFVRNNWQDVLIIFFTELLDVNPGGSIRISWISCRLSDSGHKGSRRGPILARKPIIVCGSGRPILYVIIRCWSQLQWHQHEAQQHRFHALTVKCETDSLDSRLQMKYLGIAKLEGGGGSYKRPKEWVGGGRKVAGCG